MDRGELNTLVVRATNLARGAQRQREDLERRPVTWADMLANRVRSYFDLKVLDGTLVELDKAIKRGHGNETFNVFGDEVTPARAREELAEAIRSARALVGS